MIEVKLGDSDIRPIAVGCGLAVPSMITADITDGGLPGLAMHMEVGYDSNLGRITPSLFSVRRHDDDEHHDAVEISLATLMKMRIRTYIESAFDASVMMYDDLGHGRVASNPVPLGRAIDKLDVEELKSRGPKDSTLLLWVARTYRAAEVLGSSPTKAVEERFDVRRTTVQRWMQSARRSVPDWDGSKLQKTLDLFFRE